MRLSISRRGPGGTPGRSGQRLTRRQRAAAITLSLLAVAFVVLDLAGGSLAGAHDGVRGSLGALYRGTDSVLGPVRRFVQGVPDAGTSREKIQQLEQDEAALRAKLARAAADRRTERQLRAFGLAAADNGYRVLPARVIATDPAQGFDWTVTVDVGSAAGVRVGQSVTVAADLVGRVLRVDASTSVILLAADADSGVGARDLRTGQLGVVGGAGLDGYTFRPLDPDAGVRVGDKLATGPSTASSFVAGLAIGTVRAVRHDATGATVAAVSPDVSPTSLDLLGIVLTGGDAGHGTGTARPPVTPTTDLAGGR